MALHIDTFNTFDDRVRIGAFVDPTSPGSIKEQWSDGS
jgi:hypothetical protein